MQHRPRYHYTPKSNWMNDPNGMVYFEGEYHLFYQYHPDSIDWGPMHWGHAVSKDLVHWEELPIALYPDDSLGYIFSGCAIIDWNNTCGLGQDGKPPMIAIFTQHNMAEEMAGGSQYQYQSIAVSYDKGRSWTKYRDNPVIPNPGIKDFRDPKVIWHQDSEKWVMVLSAYDKVMIYNSPDLIDWTYVSEFGITGDTRLWECPDLFPLMVEGLKEIKWILLVSIQKEGPNSGSATSYFVGDFDGISFISDAKEQRWVDYGKDNYAMVTWSDISKADGRILALGWMSNWQYAESTPTKNWRGAMTLPRELTLRKEGNNCHLISLPVRELTTLEKKCTRIKPRKIIEKERIDLYTDCQLYKLDLKFEVPGDGVVGVRMSNENDESIEVYYNGSNKEYCIDRTKAGKFDFNELVTGVHFGHPDYVKNDLHMIIYLDVSSVELFADKGRCVMTDIFFPTVPFNRIEIFAVAIPAILKEGYITELQMA